MVNIAIDEFMSNIRICSTGIVSVLGLHLEEVAPGNATEAMLQSLVQILAL